MSPIRKKELRQINSFFKSLKAQKVETLKEKFVADPDGHEEDVESVEAQVLLLKNTLISILVMAATMCYDC